MKIILGILMLICGLLYADENLREPDLIQFYMEKGDYENALSVVENARVDSSMIDSLNFFKAIILEKINKPDESAKVFGEIIISSQDSILVDLSQKYYLKNVNSMETLKAIDNISSLLDSLSQKPIIKNMLFAMAAIYERNLLYEEANDVYQSMVEDTLAVDTLSIYMKIALNDIYLKKFLQSRILLDSLALNFDNADSSKIDYLKYMTYFKEKNYKEARKILLHLYSDYPNHPERNDIIHSLAKTYLYDKQYLMTWYLLNELYHISSESQKFKLFDEIESVKKKFIKDKTVSDQFRDFIPKWKVDCSQQKIDVKAEIQQKSQ